VWGEDLMFILLRTACGAGWEKTHISRFACRLFS
jgi:hypothetical protein